MPLPKYLRLSVYSFCSTFDLFYKLTLLSKSERELIRQSLIVGKRIFRIRLGFYTQNEEASDDEAEKCMVGEQSDFELMADLAKEIRFEFGDKTDLKLLKKVLRVTKPETQLRFTFQVL